MSATDPRAAAIEALGYARREAAFLACVTRQGGYFLRRQFLTWMGCTPGRAVVAFTQHLLARRHATRQTFCRQTHVYHLASRVLYEGAPTSTPRDRRRRSALVIKARLMAVDLAMAHREVVFLATEQERVDYCDRLGVDRARLPQHVVRPYRSSTPQIHYFPHPSLVGLRDADGPAPTVVCAYVDDGDTGATGFSTFLRRHGRLLAVLPRWQVVYVAERSRQIAAASAVFARAYGADAGLAGVRDRAELGEYFRLRRLYDQEAWSDLQTVGLNRYLELRTRLGDDVDPLYAQWELHGDHVLQPGGGGVEGVSRYPRFEAVLLPYSYGATASVHARSLPTNPGAALS
jgi:hypothetical protein